MGLDGVELLMAVEEEFGIAVADEDAWEMTTPGRMADYVLCRVRMNKNAPCPSQVGFHRLRSVLMNSFGIPRKAIHPRSSMSELLERDIPGKWKKLNKALGIAKFPALKHSRLHLALINCGFPAASSAFLAVQGVQFPFLLMVFLLACLLVTYATRNTGTLIPEKCQTVAMLTRYAKGANTTIWTREAILDRIFLITSIQLNVLLREIHEHALFVDDLGLDQ
ncbi:MAG: phosphopantetheine-binding protein [Azoarcus sp.]|nr:phosphopantetheine-binding protein [Azoarcus sp.]